MGQLFCCGKVNDEQHYQSQYLLQMNRYKDNNIYRKIEEPFTYNKPKDLEENIISKNGKFSMFFYDMNSFRCTFCKELLRRLRHRAMLSILIFPPTGL